MTVVQRARRLCLARRRVAVLACAAAALGPAATHSRAAEVTSTWFGQSGFWGNARNWNNVPAVNAFPNNAGNLTFDAIVPFGTVTLDRNITIQRLNLNGGTINHPVGAAFTLTLNEGGSWSGGNFTGNGTLALGGQSAILVRGGGNTLSSTWAVNNAGAVSIASGTLVLAGGGTGAGSFDVGGGATLDLNSYTFEGGAAITGDGRVRADGGTLTALAFASVANVDFSAGSFAGPGTLRLTGTPTWTGGTMAAADLGTTAVAPGATLGISGAANKTLAGRTLSNGGTVKFTSGAIRSGAANSFIDNGTRGLFDTDGADGFTVVTGAAPGTFNNAGAFRKGSLNTFDSAWVFNNSGAVNADAGTLRLSNGGDHAGSFAAARGAAIDFGGGKHDLQAGSSATGAGTVRFSGGDSTVAGGYVLTGVTHAAGGSVAFLSADARSEALLVSGGTVNGVRSFTATDVTNTGGTLLTSTGTLRGGTVALRGGTTTVGSGGGRLFAGSLLVSGGTNTVQPGGRIGLGSAAQLVAAGAPAPGIASAGFALGEAEVLTFTGAANPTVNLTAHATTPGTVVLGGDVVVNVPSGTARITSVGVPPVAGTVDLNAAQRAFTVADGTGAVDMEVSARLTNGGLRKSGPGTLSLTGANDYAGGTTVAGGALEVTNPAALGAGPVTFSGGRLNLRANSADTTFANALTAAPADGISVDVGRVGGAAATVRVPAVTMGAALDVSSASASTLAVTGAVTLTADATINHAPAVTFNGAVGGAFGFTKTLGGTLTLGGASANTHTGATVVNEGELVLAKTGGALAVPGSLRVNGPGQVRLTAANQIADAAAVTVNAAVQNATLDLNGHAETIGSLENSGTVLTRAGSLSVGPVNGTGSITVAAGGSLTANHVRQNTLSVTGTAAVRPRASGGATSAVKSLVLGGITNAWTGKFDLADTALVVDYPAGGVSPLPTIANQLRTGYAGGSWTGNGITSTSAASTPGNGVGFAEASAILGAAGGTFRGQPADGSAVLVRYTLYGDTTLDGLVDSTDFARLAGNFGRTGQSWFGGDFNYDARVDSSDFALLAANFGRRVPGGEGVALTAGDWAAVEAFGASIGVPVPEPGAAALLALAATGLLRRRRASLITIR